MDGAALKIFILLIPLFQFGKFIFPFFETDTDGVLRMYSMFPSCTTRAPLHLYVLGTNHVNEPTFGTPNRTPGSNDVRYM